MFIPKTDTQSVNIYFVLSFFKQANILHIPFFLLPIPSELKTQYEYVRSCFLGTSSASLEHTYRASILCCSLSYVLIIFYEQNMQTNIIFHVWYVIEYQFEQPTSTFIRFAKKRNICKNTRRIYFFT